MCTVVPSIDKDSLRLPQQHSIQGLSKDLTLTYTIQKMMKEGHDNEVHGDGGIHCSVPQLSKPPRGLQESTSAIWNHTLSLTGLKNKGLRGHPRERPVQFRPVISVVKSVGMEVVLTMLTHPSSSRRL